MANRHEDQTDVHRAHRWEHANSGARTAQSVSSGDLGKISWQQDDDTFWLLSDTGPSWTLFGQGDSGDKGDTGTAGAQGGTGDQGDTGVTGAQGDTGADSTVKGDTGDQGDQGDTGDVGAQGDKGDTGAGVSATGEIFLTASGGWPSTTDGCASNIKNEYGTNDIDVFSLDFPASVVRYSQWSVWMPDDWDGGTITADFIWTSASGSGTIIWGLQGRSYANDENIDQVWGTAQEVTDTLLLANKFHFSPTTAAITLAGTPAAGEFVQIRVYRDGVTDSLGVDGKLLGVKVYYTRS